MFVWVPANPYVVYVHHMHAWCPQSQTRTSGPLQLHYEQWVLWLKSSHFPSLWTTHGCEPPCGCWGSNLGPLEEQPVLSHRYSPWWFPFAFLVEHPSPWEHSFVSLSVCQFYPDVSKFQCFLILWRKQSHPHYQHPVESQVMLCLIGPMPPLVHFKI